MPSRLVVVCSLPQSLHVHQLLSSSLEATLLNLLDNMSARMVVVVVTGRAGMYRGEGWKEVKIDKRVSHAQLSTKQTEEGSPGITGIFKQLATHASKA